MTFAAQSPTSDTPEARHYNRIRRWLGVADFLLGLAFLLLLLITRLTGTLRDLASWAANQNYSIAVFFYVVMLLLISKILGVGLDYYGIQLEDRYERPHQNLHDSPRD